MTLPVTALLVDDQALVRDVLAARLGREEGIRLVGTAADADEAVGLANTLRPQIVIFDIDMPGLLSFAAARTIRARLPDVRFIFLSWLTDDRHVEEALAVQAAAYVAKEEPFAALVDAIYRVATGGTYFSPQVRRHLAVGDTGPTTLPAPRPRTAALSLREREVLQYLSRGQSNREIADTMHVAARTVDAHVNRIMTKLGIHDRVGLVRLAMDERLVDPLALFKDGSHDG